MKHQSGSTNSMKHMYSNTVIAKDMFHIHKTVTQLLSLVCDCSGQVYSPAFTVYDDSHLFEA